MAKFYKERIGMFLKFLILVGIVFTIGGIIFLYKNFYSIKPSTSFYGKVIILNGPSASGKTSLQKEFQELMRISENQLWIKLGIDTLFDNPLPDITLENIDFYKTKNTIRWVENAIDDANNLVINLFLGTDGRKVIYGMNRSIAAYAKAGNNIIVDYIGYEKQWYQDLENQLKDIPHYWVKISIDLEELEKREITRNTSPKGHARSHYFTVHDSIKYDFEIDCNTKSAQELALELKNKIIEMS